MPPGLVLAAVANDISGRRGNVLLSSTISELMVPMILRVFFNTCAIAAVLMMPSAPAPAATCGTGNFQGWLDEFKAEAAAKGISPSAIASGHGSNRGRRWSR